VACVRAGGHRVSRRWRRRGTCWSACPLCGTVACMQCCEPCVPMCAHVCHVSGVSCVERRPESGRVRYGCWQPAAVGQVLSALLGMSREDIKAAPSWLSVQELAECARIRVARARDDDGRPCSNGLRDGWRGSLWAWRGVLYACALCGVSMLLSSMRAIACPCEQGMEEAQYALGMLYLGGGDVQGMRQDVGKGLHWIRKAASKDHGAPCAARVCTVCGQCVASVWGASHLLRAVPSTARIRPIWPAAPCSRQQRPSAAPFSPPRASGQKRLGKRAAWCSSRLCVSPVRAACCHGTRVQRVRSMSWPSAGVSAGASTRMKARPCSGCARCPLRLDAAVCALPLASPTPHSPRLRACVRSLAARLRPPSAASSPFDIAGERVGGTAVRAVHAVLCVRCVALTRWPSCAHVI